MRVGGNAHKRRDSLCPFKHRALIASESLWRIGQIEKPLQPYTQCISSAVERQMERGVLQMASQSDTVGSFDHPRISPLRDIVYLPLSSLSLSSVFFAMWALRAAARRLRPTMTQHRFYFGGALSSKVTKEEPSSTIYAHWAKRYPDDIVLVEMGKFFELRDEGARRAAAKLPLQVRRLFSPLWKTNERRREEGCPDALERH